MPEPELMAEAAQARAYAEADFAEPHDRFVDLLRVALPDLAETGAALDLGCGPADVTLRFARAFPGWSIDGLDGSPAMLQHGHEAVERAGLAKRVRLVEGTLPSCSAPRASYDLVFSNSLLHHLPDPKVLWQSIELWARPGAAVFVMDLARPESREAAHALVARDAPNEPEVLRRDFFHSLLAAWRIEEVEAQLEAVGLIGLRAAPGSDRHWIVWGRR